MMLLGAATIPVLSLPLCRKITPRLIDWILSFAPHSFPNFQTHKAIMIRSFEGPEYSGIQGLHYWLAKHCRVVVCSPLFESFVFVSLAPFCFVLSAHSAHDWWCSLEAPPTISIISGVSKGQNMDRNKESTRVKVKSSISTLSTGNYFNFWEMFSETATTEKSFPGLSSAARGADKCIECVEPWQLQSIIRVARVFECSGLRDKSIRSTITAVAEGHPRYRARVGKIN